VDDLSLDKPGCSDTISYVMQRKIGRKSRPGLTASESGGYLMRTACTRRSWLAAVGSALHSTRAAEPKPNKPIQGAFMILSTPYTLSKAVDYEDLGGEVDFLNRCGAHGIVWPQLASELLRLTKEERMRGMEALAKAAKGKKPALVLGVQGDDTREMLEYASHAEGLEPDAMIAIPPKRAKSLEDYREYFRALCRMTRRPVFIQTSGGAPGIEPTVEFIVELAKEFPNFGYIKEEHEPVIARMQALLARRPDPIKRVFGAQYGTGWLYEMRLGSDGTITGGAMYGDIYARLWDLHQQNKLEEKRDLFSKLLLMLNLDKEIPATRLYMLKKRGVFKTTVSRQREYKLTRDQVSEIDYRFEALKPYLKA
jgi:dihydrodipicolinate synthase/N-acetylneuraminate lyase